LQRFSSKARLKLRRSLRGRTTHPGDWYSEGTWVAYQVTARLQLGLRGEILKDIDGFDTGLPQTLWEITTFQIRRMAGRPIRVP
jgi:hypothetical protein